MKIKSAQYIISGTRMEHFPAEGKPEFLLSGRSNVGKSSFINMVLNNKSIAKISSKPGKTQTINYFLVNEEFYFVDVPGYGYAKVSKKRREEFGQMIEHYLKNRKSLRLVFLLVDFRHEPSVDDKMMFDFLKYYNLKIVCIATKKDKVNQSQYIKHEKMIRKSLGLTDEPLIPCSIETKAGLEEVYAIIEKELS